MALDSGSANARRWVGIALGGLGAIAVAALLVPLRTEMDNTNLALVLVLVVVLAAIFGGRAAAAVTAVVATLAFDFFLAPPYLSMRVASADDLETVLFLLAVGLIVGEVAARGRASRRHQQRAADAIDRVQRVAELVVAGAGLARVLGAVTGELTGLLSLADCWLELPPFLWVLPQLERGGTIGGTEHHYGHGGFALSADGTELAVLSRGRQVARLVLIGDPDVDTALEERVVAIALADQLGSAFAMAGADELHELEERTHRD
jgi:hypothetical protein